MARSIYSSFKGLGHEFEESVICEVCDVFKKNNDATGIVVTSGTEKDKFEGTDAIIWGIPCDFTYNYSSKDHMVKLPGTVSIFGGTEVKFGVRTGNSYRGYKKFKTPVLVIGIDIDNDSVLGTWMNNIVNSFAKNIEEILNVGQSAYWDWCDAQ